MIKIKASIELHQHSRRTPIRSGYTPDFDFVKESLTGGYIILLNKNEIFCGEKAEVEIRFLHKDLLGEDFAPGTKFTFYEGKNAVGEGQVKEIIQTPEDDK